MLALSEYDDFGEVTQCELIYILFARCLVHQIVIGHLEKFFLYCICAS